MANTQNTAIDTVTILEFDSYEQHTNNDVIAFSKPFFNGIFLLSADFPLSDNKALYYGDTMTMRAWNMLKIPFGAIADNEEVLTYHNGWKYFYNYAKRTFDAYDEHGVLYIHRDNIKTVGDLHIDFTIQTHHSFEIYVGNTFSSDFEFYQCARHKKTTFGQSPVIEGQQGYDSLYGYNDVPSFVNYLATNKRIAEMQDDYTQGTLFISRSVDTLEAPVSVGHTVFGNCNSTQETKVYDDKFKVFDLTFIKPTYWAQMLKWNILLPLMSRCIYPSLYGTERVGETHNNRPVYEPWLIWGVFKFLFLHRDDDDNDAPDIDVFDLSPNWSY